MTWFKIKNKIIFYTYIFIYMPISSETKFNVLQENLKKTNGTIHSHFRNNIVVMEDA